MKSSIGIETVDVDAATDLGILCCNSPTPENYLGVAEATVGLMVMLFQAPEVQRSFAAPGRLEGAAESRHADDWVEPSASSASGASAVTSLNG